MLVDCWRFVENHGRRPTIKGVMRLAREVGARFDEHDARELLRPFLQNSTPLAPRSHPESTPLLPHVYPAGTPVPPTKKRGSRARSIGTPSSEAIPSPNGDGQPPWVLQLRKDVTSLQAKTLAELTRDERVVLGRYHAWRFENHSKSEAANRTRGVKHVASLADLSRLQRYADVTVGEYISNIVALAKSSGALIRSPWALKGAIEEVAAE